MCDRRRQRRWSDSSSTRGFIGSPCPSRRYVVDTPVSPSGPSEYQPRVQVPRCSLGDPRVTGPCQRVEGVRNATGDRGRSGRLRVATPAVPDVDSPRASSSVPGSEYSSPSGLLDRGRLAVRERVDHAPCRFRHEGISTTVFGKRDLGLFNRRSTLLWSPHRQGEGAPLVATPGTRAVLDEHSSDVPLALGDSRQAPVLRDQSQAVVRMCRCAKPSGSAQRCPERRSSRGFVPGCGRRLAGTWPEPLGVPAALPIATE